MNYNRPKRVTFKCTRCALCCGDTPRRKRRILMLQIEAQRISETVQKPVSTFAKRTGRHRPYTYEMMKTPDEGECFFLRSGTCTIYGERPLVCRFYPFRLQTIKTGVHQFHYTKECPGIGKGRNLSEAFFEDLFQQATGRLSGKKVNTCDRMC